MLLYSKSALLLECVGRYMPDFGAGFFVNFRDTWGMVLGTSMSMRISVSVWMKKHTRHMI